MCHNLRKCNAQLLQCPRIRASFRRKISLGSDILAERNHVVEIFRFSSFKGVFLDIFLLYF